MSFIQIRQVDYSYPRKTNPAVAGINLTLEGNCITALVGPNGSGKTTLTKLMIGLLPPSRGEVYLAGRSLKQYTLAQIGRRIGYVFQNPDLQLFCPSVAEEIAFGMTRPGQEPELIQEKVDFYLDYFELGDYRNAFPLHLSQGEKQRLAIAAVLANEPEFLILDEPTIGLDAYRKKRLEDYLGKVVGLGRGMLLVSHDLVFVNRMAARVVGMENGRITSDSGQEGGQTHEY